jgi:hypothetical protein
MQLSMVHFGIFCIKQEYLTMPTFNLRMSCALSLLSTGRGLSASIKVATDLSTADVTCLSVWTGKRIRQKPTSMIKDVSTAAPAAK